VKNSKHLANELVVVTIDNDEILNSHDVVSLFTNTPVDKALDVITERLQKDSAWKRTTQLGIDDIIELLEFVLTTTYSILGDKYTARGSAQLWVVSSLLWWRRIYAWNSWNKWLL